MMHNSGICCTRRPGIVHKHSTACVTEAPLLQPLPPRSCCSSASRRSRGGCASVQVCPGWWNLRNHKQREQWILCTQQLTRTGFWASELVTLDPRPAQPFDPAPMLLRRFVHVPFFSSTHTKPASKASAWRAYMNNNGALTQSRRRGRNRNTNNCLLQCDTSHTPGMIWMLNTRWLMHECGAGATNWKWDYNATAAAENTAVRGIVMHT